MDLVHVWYDNRYWSKILHSAIPIPIHDFKVNFSFFAKPSMNFIQLWRDNRALSEILFSTIPTPMHDLKVKDLELLC